MSGLDWRTQTGAFPPGQLAEIMAREVSEIVDLAVSPLDVETAYRHPYDYGRVRASRLEFVGRFMRDSNGVHRIAVGYTVSRRRWLRTRTRDDVGSRADLEGWL